MPKLKIYNVFISHAWKYDAEYYRIEKLLKDAPNFSWKNYSVPQHDPLGTTTKKDLEETLRRHIRPTHVVVILSGMYVAYRDWIQKEIDIASEMGKPIIGIKPWGRERMPQAVQNAAKEIVGWNTSSVVSAIRKHAL